MLIMGIFCLLETSVFALFCTVLASAQVNETCEDIQSSIYQYSYYGSYYTTHYWYFGYGDVWYNMSFWGGYYKIPAKDEVDDICFRNQNENLLVLEERHPDVSTLGSNIVKLKACVISQNRVCGSTFDVEVRKCQGDLLYRNPWQDYDYQDYWNHYICLDRIYTQTCSETAMQYSAGNVEDDIIHFDNGDIQIGWLNGFVNGKQFSFPSVVDLQTVFDKCFSGWGYILQDPVPVTISDTPIRLSLCSVYNNNYYMYDYNNDNDYYIHYDDNGNCRNYLYARVCSGKLQFDLSFMQHWWHEYFCLIHKTNVFVNPEIKHVVNYIETAGLQTKQYSPQLQYRCSFDTTVGEQYLANWYINGTLMVQKGPSRSLDDLVFNEEYLNDLPLGYEVQCGVVISVSEVQTNETLSDVFFAGWKISSNKISLRKSGYAFFEVEQTLPYGCTYTDNETPQCTETLSAVEPTHIPDVCAGGVLVQDAEHPKKSQIEVKSLKEGEAWSNKKYQLKLSTIDENYDDETELDLELSVTRSTGQVKKRAVRNEVVGAVHVSVTDFNKHWNKKCYSHVDPHHRTADGQYFEMQRPGDHMLYLNQAYQTEIQQAARYCTPEYDDGPVCACGMAIRVGADAFVINRCPDIDSSFEFDYRKCNDGGLIDIEKINDFRYMITTPIGTKVDIFLHTWSKTMNIDIYMSAKDVGNVIGLCGYFDGDRSNDLLHRDNMTVSDDSNRNYLFSDSWKLTDEENLFRNKDRIIEPWNPENAGGPGNACSRPRSITQKKCDIPERKKRSLRVRREAEVENKRRTLFSVPRSKRSVVNYTTDEAREICNQSVYMTPAVEEFSDKLADEDPDVVVEQCVYDLTQGNDTSWVEAHTASLNNAADAVLSLNPVFVANHSEAVKQFLSKTCLNNCSQNGICLETGLCECSGVFRGPYCSFDIRIPPVVYEVTGGDICDPSDGDDCTCFQIRTENVFEGFMCDISKQKVYFNGTIVLESNKKIGGDYHDIFTGLCCDQDERKKRSTDDNDISVTMYVFNVSNDGTNYGDPNIVYVYDTACIEQDEVNGTITFKLKEDFCYIDGGCVMYNSRVLATDECAFCNPSLNPYNWTKGNCDESEDQGLQTSVLVGIIIGSLLAITAVVVLVYSLCLKLTKEHRTIQDSHSNLRNSLASMNPLQVSKPLDTTKDEFPTTAGGTNNETGIATYIPDISFTDAAKPLCNRSILAAHQPLPDLERPQDATDFDCKGFAKMDDGNGQQRIDSVTTISVKSFELN